VIIVYEACSRKRVYKRDNTERMRDRNTRFFIGIWDFADPPEFGVIGPEMGFDNVLYNISSGKLDDFFLIGIVI